MILDFCLNERNQQGIALKILTSNQILSRLPVSLAQLKAGNNSEKLKKQLYKSFINIIQGWKQFLWTAKIVKQVNHTDLDWI